MPVKVKCPGCEAVLNAPDRARGKAVKCPKCGTAVRVPAEAPAKRKPASVASGDSSEFFSGLDLGRLEDRSTRVCPKCGTIVGAEDVDCPMCGADLTTGGMGTVQRARAGRKGAHPSEYYSKALKDAARYLGKKQALAWKSVLIFACFGVFAMLAWLMLIYCHNWPPQMFWLFVATVLTLLIPGWVWVVQNQLVKRALETKREKEPVRFEPFIAVSLGIKAVVWSLVFGFPVWILFGMPGILLGGWDGGPGMILMAVAVGLFLPIALICWPVAQAHFAMPVTSPGWLVHKVLPDVGRNIGPSLYWAVFALLTALPIAGAAAGGWLLAAPKLDAVVETLEFNARLGAAKQVLFELEDRKIPPTPEQTKAAEGELKDIAWLQLLWPAAAILPVALLGGFWTVYNARSAGLFVKLFRPNIENLIQHEKEYVYVAKTREERDDETAKQAAASWSGVLVTLFLAAALGSAGGLIYATFGDNVGYLLGWGTGLFWAGLVYHAICRFGIIGLAFQESPGWGIGSILTDIVIWIFAVTHWNETKFAFVGYWVALFLISLPGFLLMIAGKVVEGG